MYVSSNEGTGEILPVNFPSYTKTYYMWTNYLSLTQTIGYTCMIYTVSRFNKEINSQQKCIRVGCIPSTVVTVWCGGVCPGDVCPEGCLPMEGGGGVCPGGGICQGGICLGRGCLPGDCLPRRGCTPTPSADRILGTSFWKH